MLRTQYSRRWKPQRKDGTVGQLAVMSHRMQVAALPTSPMQAVGLCMQHKSESKQLRLLGTLRD